MANEVTFRPYAQSDAKALFGAVHESLEGVGAWMPWCTAGFTLADAEAWIEATIHGRDDATMFDFAVFADGSFAGACGINRIDWSDRVANLGYWVRDSLVGRGIATKAAGRVLEWAFANTELNRIEIVAAVGNIASQRVAEKLGASRDAILRKRLMVQGEPHDGVLYSVVRPG